MVSRHRLLTEEGLTPAKLASPSCGTFAVTEKLFDVLEAGEELPAHLFAVAAGGRADAAMLMHFRVLFALLGAETAGGDCSFQLRPQQLHVGLGLPYQDFRRGFANIRAVEIETDAADQHLDVLLAEAGVRT